MKEKTTHALPNWAPDLLDRLTSNSPCKPEEILDTADEIASRLAPDTRSFWKWVLIAQGAATLAPLTWLLLSYFDWPIYWAALPVALSVIAVTGICWWLRWRGMQHTWARARVIAEVARSLTHTSRIDRGESTSEALSGAPELQAIADRIIQQSDHESSKGDSSSTNYKTDRIEHQLNYYRSKLEDAHATRKQLNKIVTVSLDVALFLAVAGLILACNPSNPEALRWSFAHIVFGLFGAALPLSALLAQLLGSFLELNRRIGRYAQQINFLENYLEKLASQTDPDAIKKIVAEVERGLLGEIIDWFYQTEHTQIFYRGRSRGIDQSSVTSEEIRPRNEVIRRRLGFTTSFFVKVIIGRILVAGLSIVVTTLIIAFRQHPEDSTHSGYLETARILADASQKESDLAWSPDSASGANGLIVIAHGLNDSVRLYRDPNSDEPHWMPQLQEAIIEHLGETAPEVVLIDWESLADPELASRTQTKQMIGEIGHLSLPDGAYDFLLKIATIRTEGEEVGEILGYKLVRAIRRGYINADQPIHLIGHSAGGFVVLSAAEVISTVLDPSPDIHVTLLDTPLPNEEMLRNVSNTNTVEFYQSSNLAQGVPSSDLAPNYNYYRLQPDEASENENGPSIIGQQMLDHSFAYVWYIESVLNRETSGFGRSPFGLNKQD